MDALIGIGFLGIVVIAVVIFGGYLLDNLME